MSPKTHSRRRSVAASPARIEFVPSRRAACFWLAWLCAAAVLTMASGLSSPLRLAIVLAVWAGGVPAVFHYVLLRGPSAVRALEWRGGDPDGFVIFLGPGQPLAVAMVGCQRYGASLWLITFRSARRAFPVFVDVRLQDPQAIRRLGCRLSETGRTPVRDSRHRQADTIPPKV